jgi:hypothetical protein
MTSYLAFSSPPACPLSVLEMLLFIHLCKSWIFETAGFDASGNSMDLGIHVKVETLQP